MAIDKIEGSLLLASKHAKHIKFADDHVKGKDFKSLFFKALQGVNQDQATVGLLTEKAITSPDEVDVHDVTIAMAKANMSLLITKTVTERVVKAYQEIINMR